MALKTTLSKAAAKAAVNAVVDLFDVGAGTKGYVKIYGGVQPDSPDSATTEATLSTILLETTAFGAATTGTGGEANMIVASAADLPNTQASADDTGTAAWFRCFSQDDVPIIDGSVGTATADMIIDNTSITAGQAVKLNSWKVRLPFKA
jgi:hypothetical protein